MTRAPWTRWTEAEGAEVRKLAGSMTAEQIGQKIGRTVEQVRGYAHRQKIDLTLQSWAHRALNDRRSQGAQKAWADPEKRQRMTGNRS